MNEWKEFNPNTFDFTGWDWSKTIKENGYEFKIFKDSMWENPRSKMLSDVIGAINNANYEYRYRKIKTLEEMAEEFATNKVTRSYYKHKTDHNSLVLGYIAGYNARGEE